jgi:hypothetical protein
MSDMPYQRGAGCDLCGARVPLHRVELVPGGRTRLPRAAWICDGHPDHEGEPVQAPLTKVAPGTSRLRPQADELFGDVT